MSALASWLESIGMSQYADVLAANDIDLEVLGELTDEDLRELGLSLGHRRKLLKVIRARDHAPPAPALTNAEPPETTIPRPEAERRQLTVLFCDLVGSTGLSARLDPEDMREVIRAYQDTCAGVIARFEGFVAKFMGDGVLAYFGYPQAHENEAERAVRAGLALTAAVTGLWTPDGQPLAARVGIATGLVVVGDLIGEGPAQEQTVVGDTPNLAARLQALAAPGQVVIAEATRRLLGASFELQDLGAHELRGLAAPVEAFAVRGERAVESRFEAMSGPALLPMVGRDQELALLLERWALAKAGEGQGVLLVGEAGIGKSRIVRALLDALANEAHTRIRYQCSPYHRDSALWPVIQQLGHAAGLGADDTNHTRLDKLEGLLAQGERGTGAAPLIADLLGLNGAARYGALDLTPQVQRARTLDALVRQLLGLATQEPVLLVLEDAHWIDPTTLELTEQSLDRIAAARVLILLTSRPDGQPQLAAHPHVTRLTLNRLGRAGVGTIVTRLGGDRLPADTVDTIIARTDGVPLFVEELTKAVLETGEKTIPAPLHDSLMARLDRLADVREVAQVAACIGREFDYPLLAAVSDLSDAELTAALNRLAEAELVFRRGAPPRATYTFKHALVQDAAYESLLLSRRQQLHARTAAALEARFPSIVAAEPERLARHCAGAGLAERAACEWKRAAELATTRSANQEAVAHCEEALVQLRILPTSADRSRIELEIELARGIAIRAGRGYAVPEAERAFVRACELCEELGDRRRLAFALRGLFGFYSITLPGDGQTQPVWPGASGCSLSSLRTE